MLGWLVSDTDRGKPGQVELKLKTPWRDGTTHLVMSPLELMQRLAALVPRPLVVPQEPEVQERATEAAAAAGCEAETVQSRPHRISLARLLKRVFSCDIT